MSIKLSTAKFGTSGKILLASFVFVANAFVWYSYAFNFLTTSITKWGLSNFFLPIVGIDYLGILASVFLGNYLLHKFKNRTSFLLYWMLAGVLFSFIPIVTGVSTLTGLMAISAIIGVNFGFGIPAALDYFAASTDAGNRGRFGGITFLIIGLGIFGLGQMVTTSSLFTSLVLAAWRVSGVVILLVLKPEEKQIEQNSKLSYGSVLSNRSFLLYFVPWAMFLLVNSLAIPVIEKHFTTDLVQFSSSVEFILSGISAAISGFLADSAGRKRLAVAGFALLGVGYAILGFTGGNLIGWWFYTFVDGIAWGMFFMIFLFTVWGDLSDEIGSEKYYALGVLPYLISSFIRFSAGAYVANAVSDNALIFSYASFFLFAAVLPLIYAPETLSQKKIEEKQLKSYMKKAEDIKKKHS
jgi:hypothetical protein